MFNCTIELVTRMATASTRSLPPLYKQLAKKTLNENPDHVHAHLISFRRWIASAPHLKVPNGEFFLFVWMTLFGYVDNEHNVICRTVFMILADLSQTKTGNQVMQLFYSWWYLSFHIRVVPFGFKRKANDCESGIVLSHSSQLVLNRLINIHTLCYDALIYQYLCKITTQQ